MNSREVEWLDLSVMGTEIRVMGVDARYRRTLRDLVVVGGSPRVQFDVPEGEPNIAHDPVERLVGTLNHVGLDNDPGRLHLHAALLERAGIGFLICGASGAGKTTIAATLIQAGFKYLTDEMVPLRAATRTLEAYPKPLTLKGYAIGRFGDPNSDVSEAARVVRPASDLGGVGTRAACEIIVFPRFIDGSNTRLGRIPPVEAVHRLFAETLDVERFGPEALGILTDLAARASCWSLEYGDVDTAVRLIEGLTPPSTVFAWRRIDQSNIARREVELDASVIKLNVELGTLRTQPLRTDKNSPVSRTIDRPRVAPQLLRALETLEQAGTDFILCGSALALHDGPLANFQHHRQLTNLLVSTADLQHSLSGAALSSPTADDIVIIDRLGSVGSRRGPSFGDLEVLAVPVRVGNQWVRGLHPIHRLLECCLDAAGSQIETSAAERIVTHSHLPPDLIDLFIKEVDYLGLTNEVRAAIVAAANTVKGTSPALARAFRRWRVSSH